MKTQQEQDREVGEMYIARAEGKTIQTMAISLPSYWEDRCANQAIVYGCRIKPETLGEAIESRLEMLVKVNSSYREGFFLGAKFGAKWQKENGDTDE